MGLGPSTKMTTLHHYNCPVTQTLMKDDELELCGIIVNGVSEGFDDKVYSAVRTGEIAEAVRADGAIVAIDGWGNHHIDFVNIIEQLGLKKIPAIGLSYIGLQGRLVCTNNYVDTIIDFNKNESGYESCIVGDNNLTGFDAMKAVALLKNKMKKWNKKEADKLGREFTIRKLTRKNYRINEAKIGDKTSISKSILTVGNNITEVIVNREPKIKEMRIQIIKPREHHFFVNSNLDFMPIACKMLGKSGEGETAVLSGITAMLTGVEDESGFQPSNIGSSEGYLDYQVKYNQAGTPKSDDFILHIDIIFEKGEGRTAKGIQAAHRAADYVLEEIRNNMISMPDTPYTREEFNDVVKPGRKKVILVKITSGLGNMYDTSIFPDQPGGYIGSRLLMSTKNTPVIISPCQCMDGVIHSLL